MVLRSHNCRRKRRFFSIVTSTIVLLLGLRSLFASDPPYQRDIAIYDRVLAEVKPGQTIVRFGDVGITPAQLRTFRDRLVAARDAAMRKGDGHVPEVVTPAGTAFKWPGGNVYYRFHPTQVGNGTITAGKMQQFRDGLAEWAGWANLTFVESIAGQSNYITVREDPNLGGGFSSSVGMAGGEQFVDFGPQAWNRGTVCHEIGHALGLFHEQQRTDRDTYVTINLSNITPANQPNFAIIPGSVSHGAYDFYSVMHYERNTLAIDPSMDTISMQCPNPPTVCFTQFADIIGRVYYRTLSKLDRAGMAEIYGNPSPLPNAIVANTKDSGSGSLRSAIYYAFDRSTDVPAVPTAVVFNIPNTDPGFAGGVFTIKPTYLLTAPGAGTTIDGATQTTFGGNTNAAGPEIVLDGSQVAAQNLNLFASGFLLFEANVTIRNLVINGFNRYGIEIFGTGASGNVISGCYIGTDATGSGAVPNNFPGIEISGGAHDNTIGGTTAAARNVISGGNHYGVSIFGSGSNGNLVRGNYIGTTAVGSVGLANAFAGVAIFGGAQANVVGGASAGAGNVISGNGSEGVAIFQAGTNGNFVQGNFIGTNAAGSGPLSNNFSGVGLFQGAQGNLIGGTTAGARNVISDNGGDGVTIADSGTNSNFVQGNFIGTNAAGTGALSNNFSGVGIFSGAQGNVIGGAGVAARNVISGNDDQGVLIRNANSNGNFVQGNFIGTNAAGTTALANGFAGVTISSGAQFNQVGGTAAGAGNVISGNGNQGVTIRDSDTNLNSVQGNMIGVNPAGSAPLPNSSSGVSIFGGAQSNTIGGAVPGARNVISGNSSQGITISEAATASNVVQGNFIGLDVTGLNAIANTSGVDIFGGASSNTIGGLTGGARNYIAGHTNYGIAISGAGSTGNLVQGNTIGLNVAGANRPNSFPGIAFFNNAQSNTVGGTAAGASNLISGNANEGIAIYSFGSTTIRETISGNSVFSNGGVGIALYDGGNNGQAAPSLSSATLTTTTNIQGTLTGPNGATLHLEFFSSPAADPSGFGEGRNFLGGSDLVTNGGATPINVSLVAIVPIGHVVTATATDPNGNTSAFSNAFTVAGTDPDGDGMPTAYENANGLNPSVNDAALDKDGDGTTNLAEFRAGTDPQNASSRFRISAATRSGNDFVLSFASIPGKTYRIERKDDLLLANWTLLADQVLAAGTSTQVTDFGAAVLPHRFYRVALEP